MKLVTFIALLAVSAAVGCYAAPPSSTSHDGADGTSSPDGRVATASDDPGDDAEDIGDNPTLAPSQARANLANAGVRVDLPLNRALAAAVAADTRENEHTRVHAIMNAFKDALGVECNYCHAAKQAGSGNLANDKPQLDFDVKTERMAVAERMWNEWVQRFQLDDGSPVFCDTCHQGKAQFLDRSDPARLRAFMKREFAGRLRDADGKPVHCTTCHGQPFDDSFLDGWKTGGAESASDSAD